VSATNNQPESLKMPRNGGDLTLIVYLMISHSSIETTYGILCLGKSNMKQTKINKYLVSFKNYNDQ
jgi:hypothetical protein